MDAGQAVHPGQDTERDRGVYRTVAARRHTAVPERRPVQLRGDEDAVVGTVRHVQRAAVHHSEDLRAVIVSPEGVQPRGQVYAGRRKEHTGSKHVRSEDAQGGDGRRQRRAGPMGEWQRAGRAHGSGGQECRNA